jgi:hypothetical protein
MTHSSGDVHKKLKSAFGRNILAGTTIARNAVDRALKDKASNREWIKSHFSEIVESVQLDAYQEYLRSEHAAGSVALQEVFAEVAGREATAEEVLKIVGEYFPSLDKFFLGLTQGRRPRAGKAFEFLIRELFRRLGYPFTAQAIINGQPDFVLPSEEHFHRNPMDCIIFTAKRTLRERWRQIVTEGTRGLGFFLATIDEKIAARDLEEMLRSRIYAVVPARVKELRDDYRVAANVISFEHFFQYHLDPSMERWRASGVISH